MILKVYLDQNLNQKRRERKVTHQLRMTQPLGMLRSFSEIEMDKSFLSTVAFYFPARYDCRVVILFFRSKTTQFK